jgi:seryl-tRNA synthetase
MSALLQTETEILTRQAFLAQLVEHNLFIPSGEPGVFGRGADFERVWTSVNSLVTRFSVPDSPESLSFPPIIPRRSLERAGYLKSFPNLCGAIFSFKGGEAAAFDLVDRVKHGNDWSSHLSMTDVMLTPAVCYPLYPVLGQRGPLPEDGLTIDLGAAYAFRHEPSLDPARLQAFHMREVVRIGRPEQVLEWREQWMSRARTIFDWLEIDAIFDLASDPFFGRGGKLLANNQRAQNLKFEVLVPIASADRTAVASFNYHQEHFGSTFGIKLHDGAVANTACLGFGLERIALAMFRHHGLKISDWPASVRGRLGL